ncbi:MAG: adenosine deaminase [Planctomycetaceae bacterium]|nr:adenosine deaminase [Planctomycetaceae bacterium]
MNSTNRDRDWLTRIPKVELHLHLEGAIPHDALWELIQKYGGDPSCPDREALRQRFEYRDFPHFIETWLWKNTFLREYEDFTFVAEAVARDFANQNILYVEAFYSPHDFRIHNLTTQRLTEAIRAGLSRVSEVQVQLVADLIRDLGPENAAVTLDEVNEARDYGVVGIGIGGGEHKHPPEPFADTYERARELGFRTSAHAGEAAGAESVWGAIRALKVDRIGHGTRAIEDPELVEHLAESRLPIELNPISNVCTAVVESVAHHPFKHYFDRGLLICINTDDPKMFHNTLADEFAQLQSHFGISRDDVRKLIINGIEASWLSADEKDALSGRFTADPAWLEE